jgi:hypothetical protein
MQQQQQPEAKEAVETAERQQQQPEAKEATETAERQWR